MTMTQPTGGRQTHGEGGADVGGARPIPAGRRCRLSLRSAAIAVATTVVIVGEQGPAQTVPDQGQWRSRRRCCIGS